MAASIAQLGAVPAKNRQATQIVLDAARRAGHVVQQVWGVGGGDHADGYASDFMVYSDRAMGDWIADYLWANRKSLGVRWIIWQQRIRSTTPGKPGTWQPMEDRGSVTQNHKDHVHVKWNTAPVGALLSMPSTVPTAGGVTIPKPAPAPVPEEDDIMAMTPAERQALVDDIARAVWVSAAADVIDAPDANPKNPKWTPASILGWLYKEFRVHRSETKAALSALLARDPSGITGKDIADAIPDALAQQVVDALAARLKP